MSTQSNVSLTPSSIRSDLHTLLLSSVCRLKHLETDSLLQAICFTECLMFLMLGVPGAPCCVRLSTRDISAVIAANAIVLHRPQERRCSNLLSGRKEKERVGGDGRGRGIDGREEGCSWRQSVGEQAGRYQRERVGCVPSHWCQATVNVNTLAREIQKELSKPKK